MDMMKMMGKLKEVQKKMKEAQASLEEIQTEAEAGAGMVKAVVNGKKEVVSLEIDPTIINAEEPEFLKDLIIAAVNKGIIQVDQKAKEHLKKYSDGLLPNIPGLDINNIL